MDVAAIEPLHPQIDPELRLLTLQLEHGKANEVGTVELDAFERLCEQLERDDGVLSLCTISRRVSRKGKPIFTAGANVTERTGWDNARITAHVRRQREIMRRLRHLPVFSMVVTHGLTLGWGTEYVLTADYCLATPNATFGLPETGLGIIPGARGSAELAAVVGLPHALRLGCTGEVIGADEALRIGLVQEITTDLDAGVARAQGLAGLLRRRSPTAIAAFKRAAIAALGCPEDTRFGLEQEAYEHCIETGDAAVGRSNFDAIRTGGVPTWPPRRT